MEAMKSMSGPTAMVPLFGCCITPFIIATTFMGLYWGLYSAAAAVNEEYPGDNPFDVCGLTKSSVDAEDPDTKWTVVFTLNAAIYTVLASAILCLFLSALFWPLAACGACGFICGQCAHLAAIIVTGVFRYGGDGEKCAENDYEPKGLDGQSFKDVGETMNGIFISQCVLFCFFSCCMGCFMQIAIMMATVRRMGG